MSANSGLGFCQRGLKFAEIRNVTGNFEQMRQANGHLCAVKFSFHAQADDLAQALDQTKKSAAESVHKIGSLIVLT